MRDKLDEIRQKLARSITALSAEAELTPLLNRIEELEAALRDVLASAVPNKRDHPAMFAAWDRARKALEGRDG